MHHCVVEIRVKWLTHRFDRFYTCIFQRLHKLFIYFFHSFCKRSALILLRNGCKASLEIVDHRKYLFNDISGADFKHGRFFFFCSLSVVIELGHIPLQTVGQFLYLGVFRIFLLFLLSKKSFFLRFCLLFFCRLFFSGFFLSGVLGTRFCLRGLFFAFFYFLFNGTGVFSLHGLFYQFLFYSRLFAAHCSSLHLSSFFRIESSCVMRFRSVFKTFS